MLLLLSACLTTTVTTYETCDVALEPATSASAGGQLTLQASPMSSLRETTAMLGDLPTTVLSVDRQDCAVCDACVESQACTLCGTCLACTSSCDSCVQSLTLAVPEGLGPGPARLTVVNGYGTGTTDVEIVTQARNTGDTGTVP